ncbi:tyrosine/phenylalanine carboxypeptidase domain-containing protein [Chlamydiota bacterium]
MNANNTVRFIDDGLSLLGKEIRIYDLINPINRIEEKRKFFDCIKKGKEYNPLFSYRKRDLTPVRKKLDIIIKEIKDTDGLSGLFYRKAVYLQSLSELVSIDKTAFGSSAQELFGKPDEAVFAFALGILRRKEDVFSDECVSSQSLEQKLKERVAFYNVPWEIVVTSSIVPKVSIRPREGEILVNAKMNCTETEVERLLVHEIEVHMLRGYNGSTQPFKLFNEGTAHYDETEEGLAVFIEKLAGCLDVDKRQMYLYAARTVAVYYSITESFYEVFHRLREYFPEDIAYRTVERAKRGLIHTEDPGAFTKDYYYISGLQKIEKFVTTGGNLENLFVGKIAIDDILLVKQLLKEGVLLRPRLLPEMLRKNV